MSNIANKNHYASGNQDILDDPQVIELLSKYTEEIRKRQLDPEKFINDHCYRRPARQEILREMRFAATLERIYANKGQQNDRMFTPHQIRKITAKVTEAVINRLRIEKAHLPTR